VIPPDCEGILHGAQEDKRIPSLLRGERQRNVEKGGPDTPLEEVHTMSSGFSDEEDPRLASTNSTMTL